MQEWYLGWEKFPVYIEMCPQFKSQSVLISLCYNSLDKYFLLEF